MPLAGQSVFKHETGIIDAEVEAVRAMIGQSLRIPGPFNQEATVDTIRHYALGIGDDNPLWCDESYGRQSLYGDIIAPPTWLYSTFSAGIGPGLGGLQSFHAGGTWDWKRFVRRGDRFVPEARLTGVREVTGRKSGPMIIQIGEVIYRTDQGEVVAIHEGRRFRIPRRSAGGLNYKPQDPHQYRREELDAIEQAVLAQARRGSLPRYWEDVEIGETLETRVKGPLDSGTMIAYYAGNLQGGYRSADLAWKWRHQAHTTPEQMPNNRPIEWHQEPVYPGLGHHDPLIARSVGMPGQYDNGWQRVAWMSQVVTDWMGDHGFLKWLDVSVRLPNLVGDTLWCRGSVSGKRVDDEKHLVDVRLTADRQDGALSADGKATVILPTRSGVRARPGGH